MEQQTLFNILTGQYGEILETHAMWECISALGIKPYKDGNQWCILAGDNIQEGICGFGDTIEDALYEFLKEVLDFQKKQKPAWSEEDEKTISDACCWIAEYAGYLMDKNYGKASMLMGLTEKLKSLRPQPKEEGCAYITPNKEFFQWIYDRLVYVHKENPNVDYMRSFKERIDNSVFDQCHWKPSKEQIQALEYVVSSIPPNYLKEQEYMMTLIGQVIQQLKRLM